MVSQLLGFCVLPALVLQMFFHATNEYYKTFLKPSRHPLSSADKLLSRGILSHSFEWFRVKSCLSSSNLSFSNSLICPSRADRRLLEALTSVRNFWKLSIRSENHSELRSERHMCLKKCVIMRNCWVIRSLKTRTLHLEIKSISGFENNLGSQNITAVNKIYPLNNIFP